MDLAKQLIRSVARMFYDVEHVIAIDALIVHSALRDDDMAFLLGQQLKPARRLCGKLREDGLISVHSRQELREGSNRPIAKDYYYINFHRSIDVIKYRIKMIHDIVDANHKPTTEKKEYACPRCKSEWTLMEVLDNQSPSGGFLCHRCGALLEMQRNDDEIEGGNPTKRRLNDQLAPLQSLLQRIEDAIVPENDFETALGNALPVNRDAATNPQARHTVIDLPRQAPQTVKGLQTAENIVVNIAGDEEQTAAMKQAEADRKAKIQAQNELPIWMRTSTVTGESFKPDQSESTGPGVPLGADESEEKKALNGETDAAVDAYFAAMRAEQEEAAMRAAAGGDEDDEDEDEEDDDDDFEDVPVGGTGTSTPALGANGISNGSAAMERSGTQMSNTSSSAPVSGPATDDEGANGRAAKKVKLADVPAAQAQAALKDDDEESDIDFEDAL